MTKLFKKHRNKIIIALLLGLLFASAFTHIQRPCTTTIPGEDKTKCVEWSKAIINPSELLNNKQNSLVKFTETFVVVSVTGFVLLSIYSRYKRPHN